MSKSGIETALHIDPRNQRKYSYEKRKPRDRIAKTLVRLTENHSTPS
jgi:hypothetical protein